MKPEILLIENDNSVREIMVYILESQGMNVRYAEIPFDFKSIGKYAPDLILIDEWISGQAGHRLCKQIREIEQWGSIPVIIISTAQHIETLVAECGADDFIRKPFDLEELLQKVQRRLLRTC